MNSLEWRRSKVQELSSQGYNQSEISRKLQVSQPTINRDLVYLTQQAKVNIKRYIDERLPEEYEKCLVGLTAILREAWIASYQTHDKREKIQALSLAKECYSMKMDLLTNATVIDDAIRFVSDRSKDKQESSDNSGELNKETNKPDYDKDEQLEEKQEMETQEMNYTTITSNEVF
jgi:hypothetical protein